MDTTHSLVKNNKRENTVLSEELEKKMIDLALKVRQVTLNYHNSRMLMFHIQILK